MKKNKKKIVKRSIDIESEFVGVPVEPAHKKERKANLTDEIGKFLSEPITLANIKRILLRLRGPTSEYEIANAEIVIYGVPRKLNHKIDISEFLIKIDTKKWSYTYFLGPFQLISSNFSQVERIDESRLKQDLAHALRKWLNGNSNQIIILPNKKVIGIDPGYASFPSNE